MKLILIGCCILFFVSGRAQTPAPAGSIDISQIYDSILVTKDAQVFVDSIGIDDPGLLPDNAWSSLKDYNIKAFIPSKWITRKFYLKFELHNSSDTSLSIYFMPGTYIRKNNLYTLHPGGKLIALKDESKLDGFQPIRLQAKEKQTYIAAFTFSKRMHNVLAPQLISIDYLEKYQKFQYYRNDAQLPVGLLLSGVLLMMIFFTAVNYIITGKKEFLYSCCYSCCMFLLIFLTTLLEKKSGYFSSLFREYLDFLLLACGTIFYIAFTRKFLDTRSNYPLLHKIFIYEEKVLLVLLGLFTYVVFRTNNFGLQEMLENSMKMLVLVIGIVYIVIAVAQRNKLMNYLAIGNALLIIFSIISFLLIYIEFAPDKRDIFSSSMFYYELGIVSELVCFLLGLTYKNRVELIEKIKEQESLKLEAEKQQFETKLAVIKAQQEERNRISADMHDDLGAGVTAIRLYSELAKRRFEKGSVPEIDKISSSANELLNNMNAIIWTMVSSNDTLDNMVAYIRSYAAEYFENTGINCHTHVDDNLPAIAVSGDIRRNVFLVVKEALSNILKHSKATEVFLSLQRVPAGLSFYIQDNGSGIDLEHVRRFGNGLNNMRKRMEERNISFNIENRNGTLITLSYQLEA